ncbi:hypothetical protein JYU34_010996 [Plutella xylostella]|uniref:Uncharacterized protein n=1 Tax=Plutella xylostella TaxID=51655 RepID=A0ABQ7QFU2_PLUXY|nr:hypothetical protein JYU34_010996 [Plutella xylostella]
MFAYNLKTTHHNSTNEASLDSSSLCDGVCDDELEQQRLAKQLQYDEQFTRNPPHKRRF